MLLEAPLINSMLFVTVKQGEKHLPSMSVFVGWKNNSESRAGRKSNRVHCFPGFYPVPDAQIPLPSVVTAYFSPVTIVGEKIAFKYEAPKRHCCVWLVLVPPLKDPKQKVGGFIIMYDAFSNKFFLQREEDSKTFLSLESFKGPHVSNLKCVNRTTAHLLDARGSHQVRWPKREVFQTRLENHGYSSGVLFDSTVKRPSSCVGKYFMSRR